MYQTNPASVCIVYFVYLANFYTMRPFCENTQKKIEQDKQCTHNVTVTRSRNHCCHGNAKIRFSCVTVLHIKVKRTCMAIQFRRQQDVFTWSAPMFLSDFNKFEFSRQISTNASNIKFHENLRNGRSRWYMQTEGHDEENRRPLRVGKRAGDAWGASRYWLLLLLLPLALQSTVGFGLSNNVLPFFPICHQLSTSSHYQHLKISFCFLFPSFPGSSPSSRPFQFLSEDLFGHPILLHSL